MWIYHSPVGDMIIKQLVNGRYGLFCDNELWGSWHSPQAVADEVYTHTTGFLEWDVLAGLVDDAPTGLHEWIRG